MLMVVIPITFVEFIYNCTAQDYDYHVITLLNTGTAFLGAQPQGEVTCWATLQIDVRGGGRCVQDDVLQQEKGEEIRMHLPSPGPVFFLLQRSWMRKRRVHRIFSRSCSVIWATRGVPGCRFLGGEPHTEIPWFTPLPNAVWFRINTLLPLLGNKRASYTWRQV